jgi:hypothetical protein
MTRKLLTVVVEDCCKCPKRRFDGRCILANQELPDTGAAWTIPDWCPLPDAPEEKR